MIKIINQIVLCLVKSKKITNTKKKENGMDT